VDGGVCDCKGGKVMGGGVRCVCVVCEEEEGGYMGILVRLLLTSA